MLVCAATSCTSAARALSVVGDNSRPSMYSSVPPSSTSLASTVPHQADLCSCGPAQSRVDVQQVAPPSSIVYCSYHTIVLSLSNSTPLGSLHFAYLT